MTVGLQKAVSCHKNTHCLASEKRILVNQYPEDSHDSICPHLVRILSQRGHPWWGEEERKGKQKKRNKGGEETSTPSPLFSVQEVSLE